MISNDVTLLWLPEYRNFEDSEVADELAGCDSSHRFSARHYRIYKENCTKLATHSAPKTGAHIPTEFARSSAVRTYPRNGVLCTNFLNLNTSVITRFVGGRTDSPMCRLAEGNSLNIIS